jgi:uncharacterized protein (UPF0276 family)
VNENYIKPQILTNHHRGLHLLTKIKLRQDNITLKILIENIENYEDLPIMTV